MKKMKYLTKTDLKYTVKRHVIVLWLIFKLSLIMSIAINAQEITLAMNDTTVEAIINELREKTQYNFIFNHEELNKCDKISINVNNETIDVILNKTLSGCGLEYKQMENTIVIVPKKEAQVAPAPKPEVLTQTIRGRVLDADSKITLPFANVVVVNSNPMLGTVSDVDGNFKLENLPVGRYTLKISFVGYQEALLPELLLGSAKELVVNVELTEKISSIGEATVSVKKGEPLNEMSTVSARSFSVEETKRYAASISDPARMAQAFAGVSTTDDASNEIVIRGNSPNWMLWRLEGVEIPSPNHFAEEGFTAGAVSILSTNMLGKSDFYTGAFPAEYGNALSGVFDLKLRNGNNEKHEYSAQIGVLGAEAAIEGPIKKGYRGSFLINYRYATLSLLNDFNIEVSENALPNYQDLSFKFNLPTKNAGTFALWGIGGKSDAKEDYLPDTTLNEELDNGYFDNTNTGMYATGISHTYFPDQKSYFKTVLSLSGNFSSNNRGDMDTLGVMRNTYNDEFDSRAIRFASFYNRKISSRVTVRSGVNVSLLNFDYFSEYDYDNIGWNTGIEGNGSAEKYEAFVQSKLKLGNNVSFTGGLHYNYFALNADNSLEPRAGLEVDLKNNQKIGFGFGMHSKTENLPVYFVSFNDGNGNTSNLNKSLELTRSTHYIASYEKLINTDWMVKGEVYYQDISKLPVPNNPDKLLSPAFNGASDEDTLVNKGQGRNYGVELTVQKFFTNNYYLLFSTSLFESEYKPLDGKWYNTRFNSNYIFNLVSGKEIAWKDNKMISLNGKILWTGGKRFIPIDLAKSVEAGETELNFSSIYESKAPDYFRFDMGVKLHFFKKKSEHILSLDIQNVTNRLNVWTYFYNSKEETIQEYPMAGLIPVLNYRIEF